jgi:hypothetical protein
MSAAQPLRPVLANGFGELPGGAKGSAGDRAIRQFEGELFLDKQDDLHDRHGIQSSREEIGIQAERYVGFQEIATNVIQQAGGYLGSLIH